MDLWKVPAVHIMARVRRLGEAGYITIGAQG